MTVTVNIPVDLEGFIKAKTIHEQTSPADYLLSLVEMSQSEEQAANEILDGMPDIQRSALEDTLEDRIRGPFLPLTEGWQERVLAKAMGQESKLAP